jgi:large subunit ribosomal protein L3
MKYTLGKKKRMTQVFDEAGNAHPVTPVAVESLTVVRVKTSDTDGYTAYQLGYGSRSEKNTPKPQQSDAAKREDGSYFRLLREYRLNSDEDINLEAGDTIEIAEFSVGDNVDVSGTTKGKGFQGVVKRHGFGGGRRTHGGQKSPERGPGSIGATGPSHVFKGTRMGGRMGGDKKTVQNLEIVHIDADESIIYIRGGIPGPAGSTVEINGETYATKETA